MKTKILKFTLGLTCIFSLIMLSACDSSAIPVEPNGCIWVHDSISAQFLNARFYYPDKECGLWFEKNGLTELSYIDGVYKFMYNTSINPNIDSCHLTWLSSVYTKKCDSYDLEANNDRVQLNQSNYYTRLYSSDVLEPSPIVRSDCHMIPEDYKHQLVIQIPNVSNAVDGSYGSLTWINTWLGETHSHYSIGNHMWRFNCPAEGIHAAYTPYLGNLREVYVYYQFIYIR